MTQQSARDVIEQALFSVPDLEARGDRYDEADAVLRALTAAGYPVEALPQMREALKASDALIKEAQGLLEAHLYPDSSQDADETIDHLLGLLDGPKQREVQRNTRAALAKQERS